MSTPPITTGKLSSSPAPPAASVARWLAPMAAAVPRWPCRPGRNRSPAQPTRSLPAAARRCPARRRCRSRHHRAAATAVEERWGRIDVWVNCAMATVFAPIADMEPEEYRRVTEVTYLGYVYGTQAALRRMRPRDRGTIVMVGSALAYRSIPLQSAYCAAKHAIVGFTDSLRAELIHDNSNIRVTAPHLPAVNTPQPIRQRNKMDRQCQPVPPLYTPEVIAEQTCGRPITPARALIAGRPTRRSGHRSSFPGCSIGIWDATAGTASSSTIQRAGGRHPPDAARGSRARTVHDREQGADAAMWLSPTRRSPSARHHSRRHPRRPRPPQERAEAPHANAATFRKSAYAGLHPRDRRNDPRSSMRDKREITDITVETAIVPVEHQFVWRKGCRAPAPRTTPSASSSRPTRASPAKLAVSRRDHADIVDRRLRPDLVGRDLMKEELWTRVWGSTDSRNPDLRTGLWTSPSGISPRKAAGLPSTSCSAATAITSPPTRAPSPTAV